MTVITLTKTGIPAAGEIPWGTHFCHFYQTEQDLYDVVLPYLKAGLENHEACLWITTQALSQDDWEALRQAIPEVDRRLETGDIEILLSSQWYFAGDVFDAQRVIRGWKTKLALALARDFAGLRVAADEAWLDKEHWSAFYEYEKALDQAIAGDRMVVLCAYSLASSEASVIFDIARTHQFTIAKRYSTWETLETPELKQAKAELKALNDRLEQAVAERTRELETINATLRREIAQRKQAEEEHQTHFWLLENMDPINRVIQGTNDLEQMMSDALDALLSIFACDRAWLVYPCDPEAATWQVPMERTRPEYPGVLPIGVELPLDAAGAAVYRILREASGPVQFGPGGKNPVPVEMAQGFGVQSFIAMAFYPKTGKPWAFGLHQCSYPRVWTPDEERLFQEISRRLADALTSLLVVRDLRESERKLEEAQRIAHVGHWEHNLDTDRITGSYENLRIFGRPQEEIISPAEFLELIHPEDRQMMAETFAETMQGNPPHERVYRVVWPTGEVRFVHSQWDVMRDESSRPRKLFGTVQDITERRRTEDALKDQFSILHSIIESANAFIFSVDRQYHYTCFNNGHAATMKALYGAEIAIGHSLLDYMTVMEDRIAARYNLDRALSGEHLVQEAYSGEEGKSRRYFRVSHSPIRSDGEVIGVAVIAQDLTERKQAEQELQATNELLRVIIEAVPTAIIGLDLDGKVQMVWNPAAEKMLGWSAQEAMGNFLPSVPVDKEEEFRRFREVMRSGKTLNGIDVRQQKRDGSPIDYSIYASPMYDPQGQVSGNVAVLVDIAERKRAEDIMAARLRLLQFAATHSLDELLQVTLDEIETLTDSQIGFYHFVEADQHTLSLQAWSTRTLKEMCQAEGKGRHYDVSEAGVWVDCVHQRRPVIHNDYASLPHRKGMPPGHAAVIRELVVPVFRGEQIVAILGVGNKPQDYTERDVETVSSLADLAWDIAERKRAEEALHHRLTDLEAVARISAVLRTAQTLDEMLPVLLDETLGALDSNAGVIWLYHPENNELRVTSARGWLEWLKETPIKPGEGIAGTVFASGQAHISREFTSDPLAHPSTIEKLPAGWGGICVPIHTAADRIGVLFVSVRLPREITPEESRLLASLAEMAGTALHRLRLHEETVRRVNQLQALRTVDRAITASLDMKVSLSVLLEQTLVQLGIDAADIMLLNPHSYMLEYAAGRGFLFQAPERSRLRLGQGYAGRAALERRTMTVTNLKDADDVFPRAGWLAEEGFASLSATPLIAKGQVLGVLEAFHRMPFQPDDEWLNFLETLAAQAAIAIDSIRSFESLQRSNTELALAYDTTIEGWSRALDLRDQETEGHTLRVTEITLKLARAAGMDAEELVHVRRGALLHDIGKMGVPDAILLKPGKLTAEEWDIMRKHQQYAYDLLHPIRYLRPALDIPRYHHERWDGTGYSLGLKGEQIPLAARLFAVVDVWDALRSDRPYRRAWPEEKVREYIRDQAGKHFDPWVVELFFQVLEEKG